MSSSTAAATTRRLLAVLAALAAALGVLVTTTAAAPVASAEVVYVTPKGRFVKVVDVQRTERRLSLTSQVEDDARKRLLLQDWCIDTDGRGHVELFASWFRGEHRARLSSTTGDDLPTGCGRLSVVPLPRHRGSSIEVPGRCLAAGGRQPREVRVVHTTVVRDGDRCLVQSVPKKGYLGPLGVGSGQARTTPSGGLTGRPGVAARGC